jgi:hypothetical protein
MYFAVIAVGIVGALMARFRPGGMARVLLAVALTQAAIGAFAIVTGLGRPYSGALELLLLNAFFVALFVSSAWLFAVPRETVRPHDPGGCQSFSRSGTRTPMTGWSLQTRRLRPISVYATLADGSHRALMWA